jgi:transcriptional regulator with XRE-family HTH domain
VTSFAERLRQEFEGRKEKNMRYSLRAFATLLDVDHATLAQVFRGTRRVPIAKINAWARRLGLDREETQAYVAAAHAPDDATLARQQQLRHWSAEALPVVADRTHFEILRLLHLPGFRKDSRWIAQQAGASVDQVNIVLQRLLRLGLVSMQPGEAWSDLTELRALTEKAFRRVALARVRMMAAEQNVRLPERKD